MRKRLRKKLRKGEFDVPLLPIAFRMVKMETSERNAILDAFITEAIEANGLQFGGGGTEEVWSGFGEPPGRGNNRIGEDQRCAVGDWLQSRREIEAFFVGDITTDSEVCRILEKDRGFPKSRLDMTGNEAIPGADPDE